MVTISKYKGLHTWHKTTHMWYKRDDIQGIQGCTKYKAVQVQMKQGQDRVKQGHMILGTGKEMVSQKWYTNSKHPTQNHDITPLLR
jgi:hypothetical protein